MKTKNLLKKAFLLLALMGGATSAWADEAIISWYMGTDGAAATSANSITGASGCAAEGFTIAITGNSGKNWSNGNGNITYNEVVYKTLKNSNGAQNTITCPDGYVATQIVFYATSNCDAKDGNGVLTEIDGTVCSDAVSTNKNYTSPTVITKSIDNKSSFTFTFSTKQVCFIAVVTYQTPAPNITTQPVSAAYQKDDAATALSVTATASKGDLSYQWYSCEDANKTNASAIGGATSASYIPATTSNGTFYYFCRVSDANGPTDSNVATIIVAEASAPTISADATATSVFPNTSVTLTATIGGIPEPTVQWYSCDDALKTNPVSIGGATNTTYSPSTATPGTYYFYAVATNSQGSATSDVITLTVNPLYTVTYSLGEVTGTEGIVPASADVESSLTIPSNWLLYKDGYTLTAWNDGSADHAIGSNMTVTANTTLTPVFTLNGENAHLGYNATTVTWDFQTKNGAPTWALEGAGQTGVQVAQTTVGGSSIDVKLGIDATSGKFNNASNNEWAQTNSGTKVTVPVLDGAVVKVYVYQAGSSPVTFGGNAGTYDSNIYSYTATADGDLEIVIGDQGYSRYVSVTYPVKGVKIYDYETSVGTGVVGETENVSSTTQSINGSSVDVIKMTSNLNSGNKNNYWKITPSAGTFKKGDRIIWTGCYSNSSTKETTIVIFDDDAISSAIVTGESFANVNGGTTVSPKSLTTGSFILTADAEALYIGRNGSTNTYLTALTVVRENETATIGDMGYTTFSSSYPLNLDGIAGGTAYKVAESGVTAKVVTPEAVTGTIAAGEGLILSGIAGATVTIPVAASGDAISGNLMVGCPTGATLNSSTPNYETCYVLINGTTEAEFANLTNWISGGQEVNIPAGKAYLNTTASNSARSLRISFGNITNVANVEAASEAKAQDGKFIENGKLVIVKNGKKFNAAGQIVK